MAVSENTIDGIINLFKPVGITSAKAVYRVRAITGVRKSGHAGSLDPAADGVLVVCAGKATKLVEQIMDLPKVYRATARLDVTSESFDSDRPLCPVSVASVPTLDQVRTALAGLEGRIQQVPPRISAIKLGGVPAYKTAGQEDAPPLAAREVTVYWTHLHGYDWPTIDFEVACGRGTYVRALIRDVGVGLSAGGCLTSLRRTMVGPFTADDAWTFDRMRAAGAAESCSIPLAEAVALVARRPVVVPQRPGC
ncbi:MAG: tRNA pseudouridine(55) synthase TruB [Phycisphaerae bacterium]